VIAKSNISNDTASTSILSLIMDVSFIAGTINETPEEVQISADNLKALNCAGPPTSSVTNFYVTNYGRALTRACWD
jgi:hypothetical protein